RLCPTRAPDSRPVRAAYRRPWGRAAPAGHRATAPGPLHRSESYRTGKSASPLCLWTCLEDLENIIRFLKTFRTRLPHHPASVRQETSPGLGVERKYTRLARMRKTGGTVKRGVVKTRRTEIRCETYEMLVLNRQGSLSRIWCPACGREAGAISLFDASRVGLSPATARQQEEA